MESDQTAELVVVVIDVPRLPGKLRGTLIYRTCPNCPVRRHRKNELVARRHRSGQLQSKNQAQQGLSRTRKELRPITAREPTNKGLDVDGLDFVSIPVLGGLAKSIEQG